MPEEVDGMYDDVPLSRLIVRDPVKEEIKTEHDHVPNRQNSRLHHNIIEENDMLVIDDELPDDRYQQNPHPVYISGRPLSPVNILLTYIGSIFDSYKLFLITIINKS